MAYRDFTPAQADDGETSGARGHLALQCRHARAFRRRKRPPRRRRRAVRAALPRAARSGGQRRFRDAVYGEQSKSTADIEDFALLRSDGMPTYHLASCADDADLRISHIIRGQDHLTNTFKHVLIFEAAGRRRRPRSRTCRCWSRPMAPSSPSAGTARWSASPLIAMPAFCRKPSSISCACSAGRPKNDREQHVAPGTDRRVLASKASIAATPWSISPKRIRSIRRRSG